MSEESRPVTAEERDRIKSAALGGIRPTAATTLRLCRDIDWLTAECNALQALLARRALDTAARVAGLRERNKALEPLYESACELWAVWDSMESAAVDEAVEALGTALEGVRAARR